MFVKVDVGQRRLGVEPRELARFAVAVAGLPKLRLEGIYTHMTVPPDPVPERQLERQSELFGACLQEVEAAGLGVRVRMAASSSVLRLSNDMNFNAVDPGRLYFGIVPSGPATEEAPFRSALRSLRSTLLHVKTIDDDDRRPAPPVAAPSGMRLGIVALGTGDGLGTASCGHLLVRGRPAPILEPISLEHCRVDLTAVPDAAVGDEVIVIGTQGGETIGIDDVAAHRGLQGNKHQRRDQRPRVGSTTVHRRPGVTGRVRGRHEMDLSYKLTPRKAVTAGLPEPRTNGSGACPGRCG